MAVHIFTSNEENFKICVDRGIVGLPEPKDTKSRNNVFDGLLSRIACIKDDDYILIYIIGKKELNGVWRVDGEPFYDESQVWGDRLYPFRCRIKCSEYSFDNPLKLNDINDLRNSGKIWTWSLQRASGSNSMFSISDQEFEILLNEYMKINPFTLHKGFIPQPSPFHKNNVLENIHTEQGQLKYEYSVMAHLNTAFSQKRFTEHFGNYTDFICYIPTNLGREMDILLMFGNKWRPSSILSYDVVEVKRDEFDIQALIQLIDYESWFLQKKVFGDMNMVRTTAIAKSFSNDVVDYVSKRKYIENKPIKLMKYIFADGLFSLDRVL